MKLTKSELKEMIRETLREELASNKKRLIESPEEAYEAMMAVQNYITGCLGWDIIDCQQDDEYSMMLKCDLYGQLSLEEAIDYLEERCSKLDVEVSVVNNDSSAYDLRVYLSY